MLISFSGNAVIMLLCIFIAFVIDRIIFQKKYISSVILILFSVFAVIVLYNSVPQFQEMFGRVSEIIDKNGSGYVRIFHGFDVYSKFPFEYKIFGIGYGNIKSYAQFYSGTVFSKVSLSNPLFEYLNGIQYVLIGGGLIGLILYFSIIIGCLKKCKPLGLYVGITFIVISFVSAFIAGGMWLIFMMLLFSAKKNSSSSKNHVFLGVYKKCDQVAR